MKDKAQVTMIHNGEEHDITAALERFGIQSKVMKEAKAHIENLIESHERLICSLLEKNFEQSATFTVKLKKLGSNKYKVETDIAYTVEKVKDGVDAEINVAQEELFKEK